MLPPLTGAEEALVDSGAKSLTQLAWQILGRTGRRIAEQRKIELAIRAYLETYLRRHGQIKALLMPQPVPLREIYTDVEVVSPRFLARQVSVDEMQELFRKGRRSLFTSRHQNPPQGAERAATSKTRRRRQTHWKSSDTDYNVTSSAVLTCTLEAFSMTSVTRARRSVATE